MTTMPSDLRPLAEDPRIRHLLEEAVAAVAAEEGSLLVQHGRELIFTCCCSPLAERLVGRAQPLARGIVACCHGFQQPMMVHAAAADPAFDPGVDHAVGSRTRDMLCVPVSLPGRDFGVATAINCRRTGGFTPVDLECYLELSAGLAERCRCLLEAP